MTKRRTAGRPPFAATPTRRRLVRVAAAAGISHAAIAAALGCSQPTMRRHFAAELAGGAELARVEVAVALHRAALRGSPSACRAFLALGAGRPVDPPPTPKPKPAGLKAQAAANAVTAAEGTDWESLLPPVSGSEVLQ